MNYESMDLSEPTWTPNVGDRVRVHLNFWRADGRPTTTTGTVVRVPTGDGLKLYEISLTDDREHSMYAIDDLEPLSAIERLGELDR